MSCIYCGGEHSSMACEKKDRSDSSTAPRSFPEPLLMFTVYDHPSDHPDVFVVRVWRIYPGRAEPTKQHWVSRTLEGARSLLPPGLNRIVRAVDDDPVIVESWI